MITDPNGVTETITTRAVRRLPSWIDVLLVTLAAIACLFLILPTAFVIVTAFDGSRFLQFPPPFWTIHWFKEIPGVYVAAAEKSVELGASTAAISLVLGVPAGLGLARRSGKGTAALSTFIRAPLQVPYVILGVAFLGYYDILSRSLHVTFLGTLWGIALAHSVVACPYVISAVAAAAMPLSPDLESAAYGLGAGRWRTIFTVVLPALRGSLVAGAVFAFLVSFDDIPITLFLIGGGTNTLPLELYFGAQFSLSPALFCVAAIVSVVTTIVLLVLSRFLGLTRQATGERREARGERREDDGRKVTVFIA